MDERRKSPRFAIEMNANFITEDGKENPCKLTDISREGTRIEIFSRIKIEIGTGIKMKIAAPKKENPIIANVITMWITETDDNSEYNYLAGGLLSEINSEDKGYLLDQAYAIFKESSA